MKNKKIFRLRKENGAITMWSALILTAMIGFTALSIDIGLHHYMGAKLQNAVDSAATAVASSLGSVDTSLEDVAYDYLAKNGYDREDERFNNTLKVTIEQKGVGNEETMYEGEYITYGYYKITADVDESTLLATVLDIDSLHLTKTAYVKCEANYVDMPKALKYTVFGGSSTGSKAYPTVDINGRTNSTINSMVAGIESFINGINSGFVQPIIGFFGGTPNYNDLVHINLSEVITDGDVHSNSNIAISVQALNASRVKDRDYDGESQYNEEAYENITVDDEQSYDDYGQVTYTAVTDIIFDSSLKSNHDDSTHVYVQNQQYLEQTQAALNIIDTIDFTKIDNITKLQAAYDEATTNYFNDPAHSKVSTAQQAAVRAQGNNLNFGAPYSYSLINQSQVVYNVSHSTAENYLAQGRELGLDGMQELVNSAGVDQLFVDSNAETKTMMYQNYADTSGSINYGIKFTKEKTSETAPDINAYLTVQGNVVNRDLSNLTGNSGASMNAGTYAGARFAIFRTFQEQSEYITVPNMKPYFVRQVNTSIRSATQTQEELGDSEVLGDRTVKEAVAHLTSDLQSVVNSTNYVDEKYAFTSDYTRLETTPLFKYNKTSASAALEEQTGEARTKFNGFNLFDSNGILKDASTHIEEFKAVEFADDEDENTDYGIGAINKYYNTNLKDSNPNYETLYAADAVAKKKASISVSLDNSYETKLAAITELEALPSNNSTSLQLPAETGVFLVKNNTGYTPTVNYNNGVQNVIDNVGSGGGVDEYANLMPTTSNSADLRTFGVWGYQPNNYTNSDYHQTDIDVNFNTTANNFITALTTYHSSWNTGSGGGTDASNKIIRSDNTGKISDYGGLTTGERSGNYHKVIEPSDGTKNKDRYRSGLSLKERNPITFASGDDFYQWGDFAWGHGLYIGKSMRFRSTGYVYTQDSKALVQAQNSGLIVEGSDGTYGLKVDNNWDMGSYSFGAVKSSIYVGSASNGEGKITMENGAIIVTDGSLNTKGSIDMTTNRSTGNSNQIIVDGDLTTPTLTLDTNSTVIVRGTLNVSGTLTIPSGAIVSAKNLTAGTISIGDTATLIVADTLNCSNYTVPDNATFYAGNVQSTYSSWLTLSSNKYVNGDLTVPGLTVNSGVMLMVDNLTITGSNHRLENSGIIYVKGNLTVEDGKDWFSIINSNQGKIYVGGNVVCAQKIALDGNSSGGNYCDMYVCGNIDASNCDNTKATDLLQVMNDCRIFVGGYCGTTRTGVTRYIWVSPYTNGSNNVTSSNQHAVVSIAGGLKNVQAFNNEQSGGTMYLKAGSSYTVTTTDASMYTRNYGTIYSYSDLSIPSNSITCSGSGKTLVRGNANFGTATAYTNSILTVTGGHTFYCSGTLTVAGVKATEGSKIYGKTAISIKGAYSSGDAGCLTTESNDLAHMSEIFCGPGSSVSSNMGLNINGYIYFPPISGNLTLKRLNIGSLGKFVTDSDLTVKGSSDKDQGWFFIYDGGLLYVGGKTSVQYCRVSNYGKMYLMGGYFATNVPSQSNTQEIILGSNADTFIANNNSQGNGFGTITLSGYFQGDGNLYIENNVIVAGNTSAIKVGNRNTGFYQDTGNTYVSGFITTPTDQGILIASGTSVSCQKNFTLGSALYNSGKLITIEGDLIAPSGTYSTDKSETDQMHLGISLNNQTSDSVIYVGGEGTTRFVGYVLNSGAIYHRGTVDINGYSIPKDAYYFGNRYTRQKNTTTNVIVGNDENLAPHLSITNYDNAKFYAGSINATAMIHNQRDSVLSTQGDCLYGICILNGGKFVAFGDVKYSDHQYSYKGTPLNHLEVFRAPVGVGAVSVRMGGYALVNGFVSGTSSDNSMYNPNALFYAGGDIEIGNPYYKNVDSGEAYDIGGTVQNWGTMYVDGKLDVYATFQLSYNVSTLLCQPNSNTFVNGEVWVSAVSGIMEGSLFMCQDDYHSRRSTKIGISDEFDDNDQYKKCFVYVGGNMYVNLLGASGKSASWFGLGGTSNSNSSRDMDIYSNSNVYVYGSLYANSKVFIKDNCNVIIEGQKSLYEKKNGFWGFIQTLIDTDKSGITKVFAEDTLHNDNYTFFVATSLDVRPDSTVISNGSAYVRDTAKIRDMTKTYIYGNFYCANYVEIGKALDGVDETEAVTTQNSTNEERMAYKFSRAGYMYVGGNYTSQRYTKIYASTALHVKDDFVSNQYLTLRHDAEIFVGKKLRAATSIDGGVFSTFRVNGSMEASGSFIKLRDGCDCFVGGNMTAWSYIELGKYDDAIQNPSGARAALINTATTEGGEQGYHDKDSDHPENGQDQDSGTNSGAGDDTNPNEETIVDQKTIDTAAELASDSTDLAKGGTFYIGKKLVTYTGYIKEFAYSKVAVGNYVFAPKYITLRSNADLWVLPPSFEQITYEYEPYVPENDGTILGWIKDFAKSVASTLSNEFSPHNGSIYSLGELTLNKNTSIFGTYDCKVLGHCVLRQSSLIYLGHDFDLTAPSLNLTFSGIRDAIRGEGSLAGFDTYGTASANGYTFPAVIYADNAINIFTTIDMKLTYLVANRGDVNIFNVYTESVNAERNAKQLPNAICSYQGNINYNAMYGKLGALFYAPKGNVDIDGYYTEIWGSMLGNRVLFNAYYTSLHRFTNWRTMQLDIAESGSVYLVSQKEYEDAVSNVDDIYMFNETSKSNNPNFVPGDRPFYY